MAGLAQFVRRDLFFEALVLLVVITSILARPKRLAASTDFPAPLGAKLIVWALMVLWMMLLIAAFGVGMYWLAAMFAIGPAYTIWRWPETISIDELQISRFAWCHPRVSIHWHEIESVSALRDVFVLRGRSGVKIRISIHQVGADELVKEIVRHTGMVELLSPHRYTRYAEGESLGSPIVSRVSDSLFLDSNSPLTLEKIHNLAKSGRVIEAIRAYRQISGVGLKEAKDYIDRIDKD